jgi:A/G-specific adenine glycosylase
MEFGALLCKPKNPACGICPVRLGCYAFKHNATTQLPVKIKTIKVKDRFLTYFLLTDGKKVLMTKRDESDIWANMYDMPLIETTSLMPAGEVLRSPLAKAMFGDNLSIIQSFPVQKHLLTHQRLYVQFVYINKLTVKLERQYVFTEVENLKKLALPKIIFIFINNFFKL